MLKCPHPARFQGYLVPRELPFHPCAFASRHRMPQTPAQRELYMCRHLFGQWQEMRDGCSREEGVDGDVGLGSC